MIFKSTTNRCLRFWYTLTGNSIGTIRVDIEYDTGEKETIWALSADKGDQWLEGTVGFNSKSMTYRFIFLLFIFILIFFKLLKSAVNLEFYLLVLEEKIAKVT